MKQLTAKNRKSFDAILAEYPDRPETLRRSELTKACAIHGFPPPDWILSYKNGFNVEGDTGNFRVPYELLEVPVATTRKKAAPKKQVTSKKKTAPKKVVADDVPSTDSVASQFGLVPEPTKGFVKHGHYKDIEQVVKSGLFYPLFITGLSGNGKTLSVENVCANLNRSLIRVNVTIETDEDDLLGGFRLEDGSTKFHKGPVVEALETGSILLLDEVDLASNKILCLQPVLEGKGVYLKKINQWVRPKAGFNIIATANTKGKGSDTGSFVGTNILNEAFLERFAVTFEQEYPPITTEVKILNNEFESLGVDAGDFSNKLVDWADAIRKTYYDGGADEIISTRRLVHIANAYAIFGSRKKAVDLCIARFDDETKISFTELYEKIDIEVDSSPITSDDQTLDDNNSWF